MPLSRASGVVTRATPFPHLIGLPMVSPGILKKPCLPGIGESRDGGVFTPRSGENHYTALESPDGPSNASEPRSSESTYRASGAQYGAI
jgi:hypothetical protein